MLPEDFNSLVTFNGEMKLTMSQSFEHEKMLRLVDNTNSVSDLRHLAKQFLQAWQTQKAATNWLITQQTGWQPSDVQAHPVDCGS